MALHMMAAENLCACSTFLVYASVCHIHLAYVIICYIYRVDIFDAFDVHQMYFRHALKYVGDKAETPFMRLHCVGILNHYMYVPTRKLTQAQAHG